MSANTHRVVYSQFSGNFVSQAGQMRGHGIPNGKYFLNPTYYLCRIPRQFLIGEY